MNNNIFKILLYYIIYFTDVLLTNNKTSLSYRSYLMIKNITNIFDGEYLCTVPESYEKNTATILYSVLVRGKFFSNIIIIL